MDSLSIIVNNIEIFVNTFSPDTSAHTIMYVLLYIKNKQKTICSSRVCCAHSSHQELGAFHSVLNWLNFNQEKVVSVTKKVEGP